MKSLSQATILQVAAIAVAAPRYMGAFAAALGLDVVARWSHFADVEIASGAAMALVEGLAVAFVFRRWRSMRTGSAQWKISLALQVALIVTLPLVATPYLLSSQLGQPVKDVMPFALLAAWSFIVAAIAPLVLAAVGYTDTQPAARSSTKPAQSESKEQSKPSEQPGEPAQIAQKDFLCEPCGQTFGTQQALNAHKRFCLNGKSEKVRIDSIY